VSPRSAEFLERAEDRLAAAKAALAQGFPATAAGAAYYAMLYAARAALSEEDLNSKTHRGTWALFRERLVLTGRVPESLLQEAHEAQRIREAADYEGGDPSEGEVRELIEAAESLVLAVRSALDA
jgi:uncharacterized protein (UPF0332 family)